MPDPASTSRTLIIGLSGPSSSGKTTLARLLRSIFNVPASPSTHGNSVSLLILHEDDFYKTDADIPLVTVSSPEHGSRQLQDWDCVESLDLPLFESTLQHVKQYGSLPADMVSKEDQNSVGESGVAESAIAELRGKVEAWVGSRLSTSESRDEKTRHVQLCVLDGYLLFPSPSPSTTPATTATQSDDSMMRSLYQLTIRLLDLKLFLPSTKQLTISRRLARSGYVTLEGFWTDPPGYVEDVVWPNYVRDHAWMFDGRDADAGQVDEETAGRDGILVGPGGGERLMDEVLRWAVDVITEKVERSIEE